MVHLDIDNSVFLEQKAVLEKALSTNPDTQKALQKIIREALMQVRPDVVAAARSAMEKDPRGAAEGIRTSVYKKILGGNINILNMRKKAGKQTTYEPPRKLKPHQRGGNRVPQGKRTYAITHYGPHDRGWILRILNSGTGNREAGSRGGKLWGNRGSIAPRNFFGQAGQRALTRAADNLSNMIDKELEKLLQGK